MIGVWSTLKEYFIYFGKLEWTSFFLFWHLSSPTDVHGQEPDRQVGRLAAPRRLGPREVPRRPPVHAVAVLRTERPGVSQPLRRFLEGRREASRLYGRWGRLHCSLLQAWAPRRRRGETIKLQSSMSDLCNKFSKKSIYRAHHDQRSIISIPNSKLYSKINGRESWQTWTKKIIQWWSNPTLRIGSNYSSIIIVS